MTITKEQIDSLAKEMCWEIGEWGECDANCYKCELGHWKHYKRPVKILIEQWERIK